MVYSFTLAGTRLLDFVAGAIVCVCVCCVVVCDKLFHGSPLQKIKVEVWLALRRYSALDFDQQWSVTLVALLSWPCFDLFACTFDTRAYVNFVAVG